MSSPPHSREAPRIADYELLKLIGSGSYGDVWLARGVTSVFCAVKVVWRDRFEDIRPYEREFEGVTRFAAISLREPSQLALLHAGRDTGGSYFFYVMELADDVSRGREIDPATYRPRTLREVHHEHERVPVAEAVALGVALSRALATLHAAGLVHRDIKPSNVVFVGGVPKLADVGLVATASAGLTFVGTEGYVPREGPGAPAADVYALGKVLYELATGLDRQDWPRLPANLTDWPDRRALLELNEVLVRACEPNPTERFADAATLLDELLLLQAGKSVRRLRAAERRTARALRFATVLAVVAAMTGAGMWLEHQRAARAEAERDALARRTVYAARIAQTQRALEQKDYGRARQLLAESRPKSNEPDPRRFEWRALRQEAEGDLAEILRSDGPVIDKIALSPDGTLLAVHDRSQVITVFDLATRQERRRIPASDRLGGFSSDGRWLVGTTPGGELQRWRVVDGMAPVPPQSSGVFRPLGAQGPNRIVAVEQPAETKSGLAWLVVWDFVADHHELVRLPLGETSDTLPRKLFRSPALSPDGLQALVACVQGSGGNVKFWLTLAELGEKPRTISLPAPERPGFVGWLPGNRWWAADELIGVAVEFDSEQGAWRKPQPPLPASSGLLRLTSDGDLFAFDGPRITVTGAAIGTRTLHGHAGAITAFAGVDGQLITGSALGELRIWPRSSWTTDRVQRPCWNSKSTATGAVFSANSEWLYVPENGWEVAVLDAATLAPMTLISGMHHPLAGTVDGVWGLAADQLSLRRWSAKQGLVQTLALGDSPIAHAGFSADCRHVIVARNNGEVRIGAPDDAKLTPLPNPADGMRCLTLNAAGTRLWSSDNSRHITCRTLPNGEVNWSVAVTGLVADMCHLGDADVLAAALDNGKTMILDATTGRLKRTLAGGTSMNQAIASVPGENRLLVAGTEGDLHCFDTVTWDYVGLVALHCTKSPHVLAVAPNGELAAVLTKTGTLHMVRSPHAPRPLH